MNRPNPWEPPPASTIEAEMRRNRFRELQHVTGDHPTVHHFASLYAKGDIISFEEALQQIIRLLIKENHLLKNDLRYGSYGRPPRDITITPELLEELKLKLEAEPKTATGEKIAEENKHATADGEDPPS